MRFRRLPSLMLVAMATGAVAGCAPPADTNHLVQADEPVIGKSAAGKVKIAFSLCPPSGKPEPTMQMNAKTGAVRIIEIEERPEPRVRCAEQLSPEQGDPNPRVAVLLPEGSTVPAEIMSVQPGRQQVKLVRAPEGDAEAAEMRDDIPVDHVWYSYHADGSFLATGDPDTANFELEAELPAAADGTPFVGAFKWAVDVGDDSLNSRTVDLGLASSSSRGSSAARATRVAPAEDVCDLDNIFSCGPVSAPRTILCDDQDAEASCYHRDEMARVRDFTLEADAKVDPPTPQPVVTASGAANTAAVINVDLNQAIPAVLQVDAKGQTKFKLRCPAVVPDCNGRLFVSTTYGRNYPLPRYARKSKQYKRKWGHVGKLGRWTVGGGQTVEFTIQMNKASQRYLKRRQIGATVRLTATDGRGNTALGKRRIILRPAR